MDDLVKQLMHATVSVDGDFDVGCNVRDAAVERLERSDAAITRANAATAAAYEVAARAIMKKCHDDMDRKEEAAIVRALASADQTAALDKLIAEAVKPWIDMAKECIALAEHHETPWDLPARLVRRMNDAILAASKKGAP